jgi:plastocyanin
MARKTYMARLLDSWQFAIPLTRSLIDMRTMMRAAAFSAAIASSYTTAAGCTANVHDNTVNADAELNFKADAEEVKPGDSVAVTMNATGVVLVDPNKDPAPADADKAAYFTVYLDDEDSDPLIVTAQASAQVTIPAGTSSGKHHLICRLHKHDGTPTDQQQSVSITVSASAGVMVGADAGASNQ